MHHQKHPHVARSPRESGQNARDQQVLPYPHSPQRPGGQSEEQALRICGVEEEGRREEGEDKDGTLSHPLIEFIQGYLVDEVEGEGQKEEGEEGAPHGEGFLRDRTAEEIREGPHEQRGKWEESRGDAVRGVEV